MIHYSKKDSWLVGVVLIAILFPLAAGLFILLSGGPDRGAGYALLLAGIVIGLVVLCLTYPLYYEITSSELIVRCGMLMRRHIALNAIDEMQPDRNPASSPAWSLDRLRIDYRMNGKQVSLMISPKAKVAFMQEIARLDSGLRMRGAGLVREGNDR